MSDHLHEGRTGRGGGVLGSLARLTNLRNRGSRFKDIKIRFPELRK